MQTLPALSLIDQAVLCRGRRWRLRHSRTDGAVFDLDALARPGQVDSVRLLSPPDVVHVLPARVWHQSRRAWGHALRRLAVRAPGDERCEAAFGATVSPLAPQWVPMLALLSGRVRRLLLADDVGMGKTVQAGLLLRELHDRMPAARSLTVVPAGLVRQWERELARHFAVQASVLDSSVLAARTQAGIIAEAAIPGETCLISMDTVRQPEVTALLACASWDLLVVDEAHLLAPGTARREAIAGLAAVSSRLLLMSATPFTGDTHGDRLLLSMGLQRAHPDRILVVTRAPRSMGRPAVRQRVARLSLPAAERRLHRRLDAYVARAMRDTAEDGPGRLAAVVLRRRACSSLHALDISLQRRLDLLGQPGVPPDEQLELPLADEYDADDACLRVPAWTDLDAERATLRALALDVRACTGPGNKVRWLARWARRCREPVLVFTEYADTLRVLRQLLLTTHKVTCIYGAQTSEQRQLATDRFRGGDVEVLLATDAAAEGLNLHERCRLVVHIDVPWTPRRLAQRTGRLDRIGQRHRVRSTILVTRGTNDEHALATLTTRQSLVAAAHDVPSGDLAVRASRRRTTVAARVLHATSAAIDRTADGVCFARVPAGRGRRVATACQLPPGHSALALALVGISGVHPLVRAQSWIACSLPRASGALAITTETLAAVRPVARFLRRALHRSQRLTAQDALTRRQSSVNTHVSLFDGDERRRTHEHTGPSVPVEPRLHLLALRVLSWE